MARIWLSLHVLAVFTALLAHCCDFETEYEKGGTCCKKCEPGTRLRREDCINPECDICPKDEYQPNYNLEKTCQIQPYCDPNMDFEVRISQTKTERIKCKCKEGYYCTTDECHKCYKHTECMPGFGVVGIGTTKNDTICSACRSGTFSSTISAFDVCSPWQKCESGYTEEKPGTDKSDRVCGEYFHVIFQFFNLSLTSCVSSNPHKEEFHVIKPTELENLNGFHVAQENDEIDIMQQVPVQDQRTENNNPLAQEEGKQQLVSHPEYDCV
ncbi:tumor necrosis factor receptor superfamily member 5-like isoform X1 [Arapaima gigas]